MPSFDTKWRRENNNNNETFEKNDSFLKLWKFTIVILSSAVK